MSGPAADLTRAFAGKRVFLTGHTGFQGSWLTVWLTRLGAEVTGYALPPEDQPALFTILGIDNFCRHLEGDVRDAARLRSELSRCRPDYVFHLAAQPLVRRSYEIPLETLQTNVLGTANLLDAIRLERRPCAVVVVTSDKCYENDGSGQPLDEQESMGGHDVYSTSKGAAELVVQGYRRSFFPPADFAQHGIAVATARAGNVVGGGDWSNDRLVPDAIRALAAGKKILVRNPASIRPWQHVVEPLGGYLLLAARLSGVGANFCEGWNFGPDAAHAVSRVVEEAIRAWGEGGWECRQQAGALHEARALRLAIDKARLRLGWKPRWTLAETMQRTVEWYRAHYAGATPGALRELCLRQIADFLGG